MGRMGFEGQGLRVHAVAWKTTCKTYTLKKKVVYTVTHRKSLTISNRKIFYGHSP